MAIHLLPQVSEPQRATRTRCCHVIHPSDR